MARLQFWTRILFTTKKNEAPNFRNRCSGFHGARLLPRLRTFSFQLCKRGDERKPTLPTAKRLGR